jgi:hypothetical protein
LGLSSNEAELGSGTFPINFAPSAILIGEAGRNLVEAALAGRRVSLVVHDRIENAARDRRFQSFDLLISGPARSQIRACAACWGARTRGFNGFTLVIQEPFGSEFPDDPVRAWGDAFVTVDADPERSLTIVRQHVQMALGGSLNRQARPSRWWPRIQAGPLTIDCDKQVIACRGVPADLTLTQFALITYVIYNSGTSDGLISNQELSRQVFGTTTDAYLVQRQLRRAVRKLGGEASALFERIHGFGVRLSPLLTFPLAL